jgi:hypothetical protein
MGEELCRNAGPLVAMRPDACPNQHRLLKTPVKQELQTETAKRIRRGEKKQTATNVRQCTGNPTHNMMAPRAHHKRDGVQWTPQKDQSDGGVGAALAVRG